MKTIKFIKVNMIIMNIIATLYTLAMGAATITAYCSDMPLYAMCMGIGIIDILVTSISGKFMISVFEKKAKKK